MKICSIILLVFVVVVGYLWSKPYYVYTNNKLASGYSKVYGGVAFDNIEDCAYVIKTMYNPKIVHNEVFYCDK